MKVFEFCDKLDDIYMSYPGHKNRLNINVKDNVVKVLDNENNVIGEVDINANNK